MLKRLRQLKRLFRTRIVEVDSARLLLEMSRKNQRIDARIDAQVAEQFRIRNPLVIMKNNLG